MRNLYRVGWLNHWKPYVFAAMVGALSVGCSETGGSDHCQQLLDCCKGLAPALQGQCQAVYNQWHEHVDAESKCQEVVSSMGHLCGLAGDGQVSLHPGDAAVFTPGDNGALDSMGAVASEPCAVYITCVAQTTPAMLDPVIAAYGNGGSCWLQGDPDLCERACQGGIMDLHKSHPEAEVCNICQRSADCPSKLPACDVARGRCVECHGDDDCHSSSRPVCKVATSTCAECHVDDDCMDYFKPGCDVETSMCVRCTADVHCEYFTFCDIPSAQCVECTKNEHCPLTAVCDPIAKTCGPCQADSECGTGLCRGGKCIECETDAQCSGGKPLCGPDQFCVECLDDTPCGAGVCLFNFCCGKTACADQGAECGRVIDLGCLLWPISCGACPAGNTCVFHSCEPTPTNTCSIQSCPGQSCGYVPEQNAYQCIEHNPNCTENNKECGPGYACDSSKSSVTGDYYYYCTSYCLTDDDCPGAQICYLLQGPTSYGKCKSP